MTSYGTLALVGLSLCGCVSEPRSPSLPHVIFRIDTQSPEGFARSRFVGQRQPGPAMDLIQLPTGQRVMRLTAAEPCTGSWQVPFPLAEKTRYRVELEVSVESGAEMGNQALVVEHNLAGSGAIRPWVGTTNITQEFNSLAEDEGLLQYRLRGFVGTLVFSKVVVTQIGVTGAEPAPLHDRTRALYDRYLYRYAVPGNRPDDTYRKYWAVDPELTRQMNESVSAAPPAPPVAAVPGLQLIYSLKDLRLIPAATPEVLEENGLMAITMLNPPRRPVSVGDRFYRVTLVKPFTWIPRYKTDTERKGGKVLLNRPEHRLDIYLHERNGTLVDYGLGTPTGQTVFYRDASGNPVLPANAILRSLPLPLAPEVVTPSATLKRSADAAGATVLQTTQLLAHVHARIPLGGALDWCYRSRELKRTTILMGARRQEPERFPDGQSMVLDDSVRIGIVAKNPVTPVFVKQMADAGANCLIGAHLALGHFRVALETTPVWVLGFSPLVVVDEFDAYRSNFLSTGAYIDEPYERSTDWDQYVRKHEIRSLDDLARLFPERIRTEGVEKRSFFPEEPVAAFDTLPAMADIHFRAGVAAFWFEHYAPTRTAQPLRTTHRQAFDDVAASDRACFAPMRGAAVQHGRQWGIGVWVTDPAMNSCGGGPWEESRATLLRAWREGARDLIFYSESDAATSNALKWIRVLRQDLAKVTRQIAVGGNASKAISVRPGFLGGGKFTLGTYAPLDTEENRASWNAFHRQLTAYANSGESFDIITDDAPGSVRAKYKNVWVLKDHEGEVNEK